MVNSQSEGIDAELCGGDFMNDKITSEQEKNIIIFLPVLCLHWLIGVCIVV
jgi:hypothetical protein